jgi:hypothetical protein
VNRLAVVLLMGKVTVVEGSRLGRMRVGTRIWMPANTATVTAIAGMVRRNSSPAVVPSAKAKAA